jgi:hypothetical protein
MNDPIGEIGNSLRESNRREIAYMEMNDSLCHTVIGLASFAGRNVEIFKGDIWVDLPSCGWVWFRSPYPDRLHDTTDKNPAFHSIDVNREKINEFLAFVCENKAYCLMPRHP